MLTVQHESDDLLIAESLREIFRSFSIGEPVVFVRKKDTCPGEILEEETVFFMSN